jgi:hypothetical protein
MATRPAPIVHCRNAQLAAIRLLWVVCIPSVCIPSVAKLLAPGLAPDLEYSSEDYWLSRAPSSVQPQDIEDRVCQDMQDSQLTSPAWLPG